MCFTRAMEISCHIPTYKTGSKLNAENYRPISVTSICCRAMEKIVRDKLVEHLEANNLFQPEQHGFGKGLLCITHLLACIEDWTDTVDDNKEKDIVYLQAAFDKVPHLRLLNKVWHMGIRRKICNWLKKTFYIRERN